MQILPGLPAEHAAEETSVAIHLPAQQGMLAGKINREKQKDMSEDLDKTIEQIQALINAEARKVYSEKVVERWLNPTHMGEIENPQGYGKITGPCGDTIHIFLIKLSYTVCSFYCMRKK